MLSLAPLTRRRGRGARSLASLAVTTVFSAALAAGIASPAAAQSTGGWEMGEPRLTTPWTADVSPRNALPEYPRPQLTRDAWRNLNGVWEFAGATEGETPPFGDTLAERILVPYPTESALSGIQRHEDHMWYRRTFEVPRHWRVGHGNRLKGS